VKGDNEAKGDRMKKLMVIAVVVGAVRALVSRRGRVVFGRLRGLVSSARPKQYDDVTLKAKVESELFRYEHEVKGAVNINAQEGIVQLRGELPSRDLIQVLVERTKRIHGVRDVENLLHTTGTEAPMHH
jgi:osmotically-inducible protein OsmY